MVAPIDQALVLTIYRAAVQGLPEKGNGAPLEKRRIFFGVLILHRVQGRWYDFFEGGFKDINLAHANPN